MTEENKVLFEKNKRVGIITLNNGDFNVFDAVQIIQLNTLLKELEWDQKIRVILIQGSGPRAFSSGFDLKHIDREVIFSEGKEMVYRLYNLAKPTIALVHGYSIGVAFLLVLACDFRYATEDAQFSLPEINYEMMFPTHGGCTILPKLVRKPSDAKYILYTGDRISTNQASQMGLIDAIFKTKEEMFDAGMEFAMQLSSKNPIIMGSIKAALKSTTFTDLKTGMEIELEATPFIDRPPQMKRKEQLEKAREYIEKYSEKREE
ncbi:MAG: enoyl-CoA hydratase/isomerase family protein [Candidatus Helarchaeota archaeon]|nr:enoyl-CoA hydratase/isomerase family protein [Candidatus Helarchaeota archaeon]